MRRLILVYVGLPAEERINFQVPRLVRRSIRLSFLWGILRTGIETPVLLLVGGIGLIAGPSIMLARFIWTFAKQFIH